MGALDSSEQEQAVRAVLAGLAFGYVGVLVLEVDSTNLEPRVDIEAEELWRMWVARLNSRAVETVVPAEGRKFVMETATDRFQSELENTGLLPRLLPRLLKRMRFGALGQWYGEAGMLLRLVQAWKPRSGGDPVTDYAEIANRWPFR